MKTWGERTLLDLPWKKRCLPRTPSFPRAFTLGGSRQCKGLWKGAWGEAFSSRLAPSVVDGEVPPAALFTWLKCYAEAVSGGPLCNCIDYRGTGILPVVHRLEACATSLGGTLPVWVLGCSQF